MHRVALISCALGISLALVVAISAGPLGALLFALVCFGALTLALRPDDQR
jgi:hypothetical protein